VLPFVGHPGGGTGEHLVNLQEKVSSELRRHGS
jgi:hypothetical protein